MGILRNISIRRKQMLVIMLITSVSLLLACATMVTFETLNFRKEMAGNLSTLAQIIAHNTSAALDFNDPQSATETLSALKAQPNIIGACVFSRNGTVFASYDRPGDNITFMPPPKAQDRGHSFSEDSLTLFEPVTSKGDVIGIIYLESDMQALHAKLTQFGAGTAAIFLLTMLVAFLLSTRLQRLMSKPILDLVRTARTVAREKNYSMRVVKHSADEIGVLIDSFNEMLAQIQQRDAALESARDGLEVRVAERTAELAKTNEALLAENAERKRAEQELQWKITERKRAEASRDRLATILESTTDLVGMADPAGRLIYLNRAGRLLLDVGLDEDITACVIRDFLPDPERHPVFQEGIPTAIRQGTWHGETVILSRHGKKTPVSQIILAHKGPDGKLEYSSTIMRDITERNKAQDQMEIIHKKLVESSRQAGMAEIATNVLHNVGNVLNSVNVSASMVMDIIKKSKAASLGKVAALLREHEHDLGTFISSEAKGRQLPGYLRQLAEQLMADQKITIQELGLLRENIEHIKEIVAMQQNYARVSNVKEIVNIRELVEDSLRMNIGAMTRHGVAILREFESVPPMNVEKHKILQILVNLVRNAKYACDDSDRKDKLLTVRVRSGVGRVRISVIDNGVGIAAENLIRIFSHGFTTRKDGHGFGLHSGALAAKEMGGDLTVHSDGPGLGATFTLDLPCPTPENSHE